MRIGFTIQSPMMGCKVDRLPGALSDFLELRSRVGTMNHAPQESKPLGCIVAVSADGRGDIPRFPSSRCKSFDGANPTWQLGSALFA